ncbi:hypothetical protein DLH72_01920 [Candidatus Gracilibacteria bacterium]|nr:MAG: hypothetical protein DLH72_01920 [Candidatus Gracilibacteria bacterium]
MFENILKILKENNIDFDLVEHEESKSCEDSKNFREKLGLSGIGSKNIVFHAKGSFYLVTTIGEKEIKARKFKKEFGTKDIRFATQEEITEVLGAVIGSIPPFGFKNEQIKIFVDKDIFNYEYFMFNPGVPTKTIRIKTFDLQNIYNKIINEKIYFDSSSTGELIFIKNNL